MIEVMFEKYGFDSAYIAIQVRNSSSITYQKFLRMLLGKDCTHKSGLLSMDVQTLGMPRIKPR